MAILNMLDFTIVIPSLNNYEHVNLVQVDFKASKKHLFDKGYSIFKEGIDTLGIDLHRIKLI